MPTLQAVFDPFLSLLYPPRCLVCRALGASGLCDGCAARIVPLADPLCPACGHSLAGKEMCGDCTVRRPAFARARALGAYEGVLRDAVHQFKYRDRPQLAVPLGKLLAESARAHSSALNGLRFDALLPVPMHPARQRVRGYNQAERLARVVGAELSLPLPVGVLVRARAARAQVGMTANERRTNLTGAFVVRRPEWVAGKTLLLIDDVMTTGSSLHECAAALKAAGVEAVYALTLAAG